MTTTHDGTQRPIIHLIANSHIDPVWLWDRYEGVDEVINTFRSACDRLDEYPELKFSASSIVFYKWVEQYAPDVFERVKAHVNAGSWEITGGWLVEADCNLPTAASFHKSAELSRRYMADRFGIQTPVAYSPDSFGHPATLPKILAETGFKYYFFCRPAECEKVDLPSNLFYWEYEGNRVLCCRLRYHYTQGDLQGRMDAALADEDFLRQGAACYFFGVGDHGGGPTKREIDFLIAKQQAVTDVELRFSTCLEFMREAEKLPDIPVYEGDLHMHAVGCYSINRELKQSIRTAEHGLEYAERALEASGSPDSSAMNGLWEKTIFNQFHDIMPGSCSPDAAAQAIAELGGVQDEVGWTGYDCLKKLSARLPVNCPQGEFRVFNSLPHPVTRPIEIESFVYFQRGAPFMDSAGRQLPIEWITPSVECWNRRWMFIDTIPARTMKSYCFGPEGSSEILDTDPFFRKGNQIGSGKNVITAPGAISGSSGRVAQIRMGVVPDGSDTWSHGLSSYGEAEAYLKPVSASVNSGPLADFLLVRQEHGRSTAELLFTLYKDLPFIDLSVKIFWAETRSILKMEIQLPSAFDHLLAQGPGGAIAKRTEGQEEPLHGWLLAPGLAVAQDGAFAYDAREDRLRITLVRSCLYGYDQSAEIDPLGPLTHTDLGEHSFRFRLFFDDGLAAADMDMQHAALIEPFRVVRENG
jgi:alpha-mannosidase